MTRIWLFIIITLAAMGSTQAMLLRGGTGAAPPLPDTALLDDAGDQWVNTAGENWVAY